MEKIWECKYLFILDDKIGKIKAALFVKEQGTMLDNALKINMQIVVEDKEVMKNIIEEVDKEMTEGKNL